MAYIYAKINKNTLRFIRDNKQVSFDYIERIAKFPKSKIILWEDDNSGKYPTIKQAKLLAQCYRVPFAGFYMNSEDINIKHLPRLINKRTMLGGFDDDSAVNLALLDLINNRDFYIEAKQFLKEQIPVFNFHIPDHLPPTEWANRIRKHFGINLIEQYRMTSRRKFFLYLREKIETGGIFIQGFQKVDPAVLRGVAIVDDLMPIIGINDEDRYPAKSFSIIHELVHIIKRTSSICNDMFDSSPLDYEEVFCNAVAGEVLVPEAALESVTNIYTTFLIEDVDSLANKFSVSSEVIARRLYDIGKCNKAWYEQIRNELALRFSTERENMKAAVKMGLSDGPKRNMSREAIDRTSTSMCDILLRGFSEGIFDKADIASHIGIGQKHINKFVSEVMGWYR